MIDNATLLIGIAFSGASLTAALVIGWLNTRQETYLVHGSVGIAMVVIALTIMGWRSGSYGLVQQIIPFVLLHAGFALVYSASRLFRNRNADLRAPLLVGLAGSASTAALLIAGYSGLGTISLNAWSALTMLLCAVEYWRGREDAHLPRTANAVLYALTGISFLCCALVLLAEERWILTGPPSNWAEDFNNIMSLVGLTGIGAITLTLHHARAARHHLLEANTDELTGVLNRRALFGRYGEQEIVDGLAVLMFDLDNFKQINDRLGHAHGDMVLQSFADVLREHVRRDDVVARLGGEEFCVILPGLDRESARQTAERIRLALVALHISIGDDDDEIATVSAGLATGGRGETFASLLRRADNALYKAKEGGRNRVHVASLRLVA